MLSKMIDLDEDTLSILQRLADTQKRSQTDIMREALQHYLEQTQAFNTGLPSGIGRVHSGRSDISQRSEEILQQAIRREHHGADR